MKRKTAVRQYLTTGLSRVDAIKTLLSLLLSGCLSSRSSSGGRLTAAACALGSFRSLGHVLIKVHQLDEADLSTVTKAVAQLDDTGVATGTVAYLLSHRAEKLLQSLFVLQIAEHYTA